MYTLRLLDQSRSLLRILPVISWSFDRKISEATSLSITIPKEDLSSSSTPSTEELFSFLSPMQPVLIEPSEDSSAATPTTQLAYYLQLYRGTNLIGMGIVAKRDFTETTITLKAHTEEHLLSLRKTPAQYGIIYDNTDICDVARDLLQGWNVQRIKRNWDEEVDSNQIDYTTEPNVVLLDKDGSGIYYDTGYITFEFTQPTDFAEWERIRWSADNEDPVYTTMAYRTWDGASWSAWSAEYEGALPDQIGIEIVDTDAVKVQVRITLSTDDQESEDDAGDPVGVTPALFAVEIIARTTAYLTGSIPASSSVEVVGLNADEKTPLQVLQEACDQVGWEFTVFAGVLYLAEALGDTLEVVFRAGTNMDISQLGDDAAEITNSLIAKGTGDGINRPQVTVQDAGSIALYGIRQATKSFEIEDPDDLETAATAYLATVSTPQYAWKVKNKYPYDTAPDFGPGDTVIVVDPKSEVVTTSRILEHRLSYARDQLTSECYLGKTRANLVPVTTPTYRQASLSAPKTVSLAAIEKGLVAVITKPENSSLWAFTEVYLQSSASVTISAENLVARKRATVFQLQGLLPKTRYYIKARYVDVYGRETAASSEISLETLKFSTPFEDMQPGDTDPDTLAFQTENGNVKIYNNGTIEAVNGIFSGVVKCDQLLVNTGVFAHGADNFYGDPTEEERTTRTLSMTAVASGSVRVSVYLQSNFFSSSAWTKMNLEVKKNGSSVYTVEQSAYGVYDVFTYNLTYAAGDLIEAIVDYTTAGSPYLGYSKLFYFKYDGAFSAEDLLANVQKLHCEGGEW